MKKRIINGVKNGQSLCEYKVAHIVEMLRGKKEPTIIHTDQGSVYSSKAYNELIQDSNLVRSMAQAGKPTDNPEKKDTFSKRILTEEPKFVQKRKDTEK